MNKVLEKVYRQVQDEMAEVDSLIKDATASENRLLAGVSNHFLKNAGKRVRPILVLLAGKTCGGNRKRLVRLAAALELIHMASLVHDDIVDGSALRRGNSTINSVWGNHVAVLLGDYFYARALELAAPLGKGVNQGLGGLVSDLVHGEFRQLENKGRYNISENDYLDTVSGKTAKFVSLCCRLGAELGRSTPKEVDGLSLYGFYTGMAYQIVDDILDITGSVVQRGKTCGQDLLCGVVTLPVIHALNNGPGQDKIRELLRKNRLKSDEMRSILRLIRVTGSIEYSREKVFDYIRKAQGSLQDLRPGMARDALCLLAENISEGIS